MEDPTYTTDRQHNSDLNEIDEFEFNEYNESETIKLPSSWEAVSNSYGRQALGCMLGVERMPQMCRSYPVAPELSQADFWHVRTSFWRVSNRKDEKMD